MNSSIRLKMGTLEHPKLVKLSRRLDLQGVIALLRLWIWTAQNRPSGVLYGMDEEDIEIAARWKGESGKLHVALVSLRLLECMGKVYKLHDWQEHSEQEQCSSSMGAKRHVG